MNGAEVLKAFRLLVTEAAMMERSLENGREPQGATESERRREAADMAREQERMNAMLTALGDRISAMRKPFEKAVMLNRSATARHIARLYYGMGLTDVQVAERIGLSPDTVSKHRSRMLRQLQKLGEVS